jgi:signal transduction histidine kinase
MRLRELLRRSFARSDVLTAWITSGALLVAVSIPGLFLYAYAAAESLEEIDRWFEFVLQVVVREVEEHGPSAIATDDLRGRLPNVDAAVRVQAANGDLLYQRGVWPDPRNEIGALRRNDGEKRDLGSIWLLQRAHWIVGERTAASGVRIELALPLRHFAAETSELRRRVVVATVIAAAAVLAIGLLTTMRAFSPLRRATAMLREVDTGSLGVRLPNRGTRDPIDRHAETLNGARADRRGFARLRAFADAAHELRTPLNRSAT